MDNVLITGYSRSGTSMLAQLLADSGYNAQLDGIFGMISPSKWNKQGYTEFRHVIKINNQLMEYCEPGSSLLYPWPTRHPLVPSSPCRIETIVREEDRWNTTYLGDVQEVIYQMDHFAHTLGQVRAPWMVKDPRFTFTLPYWNHKRNWPQFKILVVERDKTELYKSHQNYYGKKMFREHMTYLDYDVPKMKFKEFTRRYDTWLNENAPDRTILSFDKIIKGDVSDLEDYLQIHISTQSINPELRTYG